MELHLREDDHGRWTVMTVTGELDLHTAPALDEQITAATRSGVHLALDLHGVEFLDSSALGVMVVALKRLRERGGDLAVVGASGSPAKVLSITGLDRLLTVVDELQDLPDA